MTDSDLIKTQDNGLQETVPKEIANVSSSTKEQVFEKFFLAALGSIPWVGGFLSAAASLKTDESEREYNHLQTQWIKEHQKKIVKLSESVQDISRRLSNLGDEIDERIQSEEYLNLVRQAFRAWDRANTDEKRKYFANVISNAAGTKLCSDDVIRLFIEWLDLYDEVHFAVIRAIYKNPGITRNGIWEEIRGEFPRDDSAEADLFKLIISDLNIGRVIRQERETNASGQFLKNKNPYAGKRSSGPTIESAFEDTKPYVLTELGKQFVHYTMNEVVTRLEKNTSQS